MEVMLLKGRKLLSKLELGKKTGVSVLNYAPVIFLLTKQSQDLSIKSQTQLSSRTLIFYSCVKAVPSA